MKKYNHLFFDLDNTLWDFERNSGETLQELYYRFNLKEIGVASLDFFLEKYQERNAIMWEEYRMGKIDKATLRNKRFALTFWDMGLDAELAPAGLAEEYIRVSPLKKNLIPHAHETLAYLKNSYALHIITNGFVEVQEIKLVSSGLKPYFHQIIISEQTGFKKPDVQIFRHAMDKVEAQASECLMIGDGLEVDIKGAKNAGWDAVYFNPSMKPHAEEIHYEINSLATLMEIL